MRHFIHEESGVVFHYSSGHTGEVEINADQHQVELPMEAILDFVAEIVRSNLISQIEEAKTHELINL